MIDFPNQGAVNSVPPQTELRLYSGVPWDNSYQHVRLYNSTADLLSHLEQWRVYPSTQLDELTPIRVGEYEVKVPFNEMTAMNINYLAFRNLPYSSEWTFCFVTDVLYKSPYTTAMKFELDIFQNNFYKCTMKPCYVEQHHIPKSADVIGGNLKPVDLETGESYCCDDKKVSFSPDNICMYITEDTTAEDLFGVNGEIVNNVYRAAKLIHSKTVESINSKIREMNRQVKEDAIVSLFMAPDICLNAEISPGSEEQQVDIALDRSKVFEGYVPKNNKLYSYPWVYLLADNNEGTVNQYKFEYGQNGSIQFHFQGCLCTSPQILAFPINYNGYFIGYQDSLTITAFPQCAFNSDVYRAWQAQNKNTLALQREKAGVSMVAGVITAGQGAVNTALGATASWASMGVLGGDQMAHGTSQMTAGAGMAINGYYQIKALDAQARDKAILPPNVHGKVMTDNLNAARNLTGIWFYTMSARAEFAKLADDYFTMFGYPINEVTTPNLRSRSTWNFVKTQQCCLTGRVEMSQLSQLRAIFDKGVTLWHTDDVGNYALSNN